MSYAIQRPTAIVTSVVIIGALCSFGAAGKTRPKDPTIKAKEKFDFAELPSKDGAIRSMKGLMIGEFLPAPARGSRCEQDFVVGRGVRVNYRIVGPERAQSAEAAASHPVEAPPEVATQPATVADELRIYVASSSLDAQEMLFSELGADRFNAPIDAVLEGLARHKGIGDFCILTREDRTLQTIRFCRDNVAVSIDGLHVLTRAELVTTAEAIDAQLRQQPILTNAQLETMIPRPSISGPAHAVPREAKTQVRVGSPVALGKGQVLVVVGPGGARGSIDAATGTATIRVGADGQQTVGVAVYDPESQLTRWSTATVTIQD